MNFHSKILTIICISLFCISQSAYATSCPPEGACGSDPMKSDNETKAMASILTIGVLAGIGVWYLMSDKNEKKPNSLKAASLSTKDKRYKLSLTPMPKDEGNGAVLQFSYKF